MKKRLNTAYAALVIVLAMLFAVGCAGSSDAPELESAPNVMPPVTTEDTEFAKRAATEQALIPVAYDVELSLDTKADRLTEHVAITVQNDGNKDAQAAYLRFNPLGYFAYAELQHPNMAKANKGKSAAIESVTINDASRALPMEYAMEGTAVRIDLGDAPIAPKQTAMITVDSWTDIPSPANALGCTNAMRARSTTLASPSRISTRP